MANLRFPFSVLWYTLKPVTGGKEQGKEFEKSGLEQRSWHLKEPPLLALLKPMIPIPLSLDFPFISFPPAVYETGKSKLIFK